MVTVKYPSANGDCSPNIFILARFSEPRRKWTSHPTPFRSRPPLVSSEILLYFLQQGSWYSNSVFPCCHSSISRPLLTRQWSLCFWSTGEKINVCFSSYSRDSMWWTDETWNAWLCQERAHYVKSKASIQHFPAEYRRLQCLALQRWNIWNRYPVHSSRSHILSSDTLILVFQYSSITDLSIPVSLFLESLT